VNGGELPEIPMSKVMKEAAQDLELQELLIAGNVPFVETIFRCDIVKLTTHLHVDYFISVLQIYVVLAVLGKISN
jgi:hypothetical protein